MYLFYFKIGKTTRFVS